MSRYVIQSAFTGAFLSPGLADGQPEWVMLLRDAVAVEDIETCAQLIEDHLDGFHRVYVVDLMALHKPVDY
ncbi:MAG: hypothetical protein QM569_04095 [Acidovorax sp.]|uniref:hypothetical protein n=1 Tax=Acidovorax sp. TaxID=1872122 RepID=UPI0039E4CEF5